MFLTNKYFHKTERKKRQTAQRKMGQSVQIRYNEETQIGADNLQSC